MIPLPHLRLNSESSVKYLAVVHCNCFYQLLDIGSIMIIRVVTNLTKGKAPCGFMTIYLTPGFYLTPYDHLYQSISFNAPSLTQLGLVSSSLEIMNKRLIKFPKAANHRAPAKSIKGNCYNNILVSMNFVE